MKISIDVDCTPEEARRFIGLPDLQPMQEAVLKAMQERLVANVQGMDPEGLLKTWTTLGTSMGMQGFDQLQKYWSQFRVDEGNKPRG